MYSGFTLLELLVVLALVSIMSGMVMISSGALGGGAPRLEAERLAMAWQALCDEAAVDARPLGLALAATQYQAVQPGRLGVWRGTPGVLYQRHALPTGLRLQLEGAEPDQQPGESLPQEPQLLCLPGGYAPEVALLLQAGTDGPAYRIAFDGEARRRVAREVVLPEQDG